MVRKPVLSAVPDHPSLDLAAMVEAGMTLIRQKCGDTWTDHNIHDPGITILESVCHAMTEVAYFARMPIADLLASAPDGQPPLEAQFYRPEDVLPCAPLTADDYRRLLMDVPGIRNAWADPVEQPAWIDPESGLMSLVPPQSGQMRAITLRGLWKMQIELQSALSEEERKVALQTVSEVLKRNRNLCEDVLSLEEIQEQFYSLCLELELAPAADPEETSAQILHSLNQFLSPQVPRLRRAEMLSRPLADGTQRSLDTVFDGPLLKHGFVDARDLFAAELQKDVRLSDLMNVIMDVTGVLAVRELEINALRMVNGVVADPPVPLVSEDRWRVPVPEGHRPRISVKHSRITAYLRNYPIVVRTSALAQRVAELDRQSNPAPVAEEPGRLSEFAGRRRNIASWYSLQHQMPAAYGLSTSSTSTFSAEHQASIRQLRSYLMFFDQFLANAAGQLANSGRLFCHLPEETRTWFGQLVTTVPEHEAVYVSGTLAEHVAPESTMQRRHQFLDHRLARVAEDFRDYAAVNRSFSGEDSTSSLEQKCEFLQHYGELSGRRGAAADPGPQPSSKALPGVSGLERRLRSLLDLGTRSSGSLLVSPAEELVEIESFEDGRFGIRFRNPTTHQLIFTAEESFDTREDAELIRDRVTNQTEPRVGVRVTSEDSEWKIEVTAPDGTRLLSHVHSFSREADAAAFRDSFRRYLRREFAGEGMYLVENLLLRSQDGSSISVRPCADPHCLVCGDADPFSFRLCFVLPAWAGRFPDHAFRQFAEETIRQETPAHLLPRICWLNRTQMESFEKAFQAWHLIRSGQIAGRLDDAATELWKQLHEIRSIHPPGHLNSCGDLERPPFMLGRNRLGTDTNAE